MNLKNLFFLVLSVVVMHGQESAVMREVNKDLFRTILVHKSEIDATASDISKLPEFFVRDKFIPKVSYHVEQAVEDMYESNYGTASTVEVIDDMIPMSHQIESSPFAGFSVSVSEFKKLKNGISVPGIGTVYSSAGARWRVDPKNPFLTRAIVSFHGGPMIKQSYDFKDGADLYRKVFDRPVKRFITRLLSRFNE